MGKLRAWLPLFLYAAIVFFLSSRPIRIHGPWRQMDKPVHVVEFAIFSILARRSIRRSAPHWGGSVATLGAVVLSVGYGITDEWHQAFVPTRTPDPTDLMADTVGAALAQLPAIQRWFEPRLREVEPKASNMKEPV